MKRLGWVVAGVLAVAAAWAAPMGWHHYTNATLGYTISYPPHWSVDTQYVFQGLGPGHDIKGVAFTIPQSLTKGTNLGGDTKLSVESLPGQNCQPSQFVDPADKVHTLHADGRTYTAATSDDAGAGNRYETYIFVIDGTSPCIAVRYFIHYSAIENFDPGTVKAFDRKALMAQFDRIRATLKLGK